MNRQQRALQMFDDAVEQADPESWLQTQCADDPALADAVRALLTADRRSAAFLAQPIVLEAAPLDSQQLGDYRLLRKLGEGGMGTVYLAESRRLHGQQVALKLLRFDAPDLRQRFVLEQRILGGLEHPAIARLLDASSGTDGTPYLVVEYVDGLPLIEHAGRRQLGTRARLKLMIQVLHAVQYAHAQLVLHRDLKPSNILVSTDGQPKLLDFGIAKLLAEGPQSAALTGTGPGPMTMEYASPEQVRGEPLDTSSDTYALGVVLYELLTGARPYDLSKASPSEVERRICTAVPKRPSTLDPRLPRDLDPILAKALAKSPRERYRSAAEFAEDLQRALDGLPVRARAPTWGYRALRFTGRHRIGLLITLLVFVALGSVTLLAVRNAQRAQLAVLEATRERDTAREIQSWLEKLLANADPRVLGHAPSAVELLDGAAATLGSQLQQRPEVERSLRLTLAVAYRGLGLAEPARREAQRALALAGEWTSALDWSSTWRINAQTLAELGESVSAQALLEKASSRIAGLDGAEATLERTRVQALDGFVHGRQGEIDVAVRSLQDALLGYASLGPEWATEHAEVLNNLAVIEGSGGDFQRALALHQQADVLYEQALGADHVTTLLSAVNSASARESLGDVSAAEATYRALLPKLVAQLGTGHADVIRIQSTLGYLLAQHGRAAEAVELMRSVVATARQALPEYQSMRAYSEVVYGGALLENAQPELAVEPLQAALAARRQSLPAGHPLLVASECALLEAQGRSGESAAAARMRTLLQAASEALGSDHPLVQRCRQRLGRL